MRGPLEVPGRKKSLRMRAKLAAKQKYPAGRALGRIEFFETQRGLTQSTFDGSTVCAIDTSLEKLVRKVPPKAKVKARAGSYARATKSRDKFHLDFEAASEIPNWKPMGPDHIPKGQTYGEGSGSQPSVSGRCVGLVVSPTDPNHLVLCTAGGGLWESNDLGYAWHPLTDDQPVLSMGAIRAAPSAPNVVYAGTGEGDTLSQLGLGLLRSSDGGRTWALVQSNALAGRGIYDIAVDPDDPLHLWVATTDSLLESADGGGRWKLIQSVQTWDISINPDDPGEIFAATRQGLIRSVNGGVDWSLVTLPGTQQGTKFTRIEVCHAPSRPGVVYVAAVYRGGAALWRRASRSGSFRNQNIPRLDPNGDIAQAWYDWCFAVAPDDPDTVYWGAVELFRGKRSSNKFAWQNISSRRKGDSIHPDHHHIEFDPTDPAVLYVCNDGGLFRSPDRGNAWESLNPGLEITEFEFITQLESEDDWLIGGTQDNGTLQYWVERQWNQIALGDGGDCGVDEEQKYCFHSYYGMWIERGDALGANPFAWIDVSPPIPDPSLYSSLFYPPMEVRNNVVAKAGVTLFVSEDHGDNWAEIQLFSNGARASSMAIVNDRQILVGTEGGDLILVKRASSGWHNAIARPLVSPVAGYISDIALTGASTKVIWVTCSRFGVAHVLLSIDKGASWTDRSANLPDIPINGVVVDPKNKSHVYIASDHGVYRTQDSGGSWDDFSNGLPSVVVGDIILHKRLRLLRIGTKSRGVWELQL